MLTIHPLEPVAVMLGRDRRFPSMGPRQAAAYCSVGYVAARSHPKMVIVFSLEGTPESCKLLLSKLLMLAGERDLTVWCPVAHKWLGRQLAEMGFDLMFQAQFKGQPAFLYRRENLVPCEVHD